MPTNNVVTPYNKFQTSISDSRTGAPTSGISVYVFDGASAPVELQAPGDIYSEAVNGDLSTLYTDENGPTTDGNPVSSGTDGDFIFFAPYGRYDLVFVKGGVVQDVWANVYCIGINSAGDSVQTAVSPPIGGESTAYDVLTGHETRLGVHDQAVIDINADLGGLDVRLTAVEVAGTSHADDLTGGVHGATSAATANMLMRRAADGKVAAVAFQGALEGDASGFSLKGFGAAVGFGYARLKVWSTSVAKIRVTADAITLSNGTHLRVFANVDKEADFTVVGLGGLDTGTESFGIKTEYHLWLIAKDDASLSIVMSLSPTAPTMPTGYTFKRRISSFWNLASNDIFQYVQYGNKFQFVSGVQRFLALSNVGLTKANWTAAEVRGALKVVPSTASGIRLAVSIWVGGGQVAVAPNALYGDATSTAHDTPQTTDMPCPCVCYSYAATPFDFILESNNIYWLCNTTVAALSCFGYEDDI